MEEGKLFTFLLQDPQGVTQTGKLIIKHIAWDTKPKSKGEEISSKKHKFYHIIQKQFQLLPQISYCEFTPANRSPLIEMLPNTYPIQFIYCLSNCKLKLYHQTLEEEKVRRNEN
jgi:hypothetical protein